MFTRAEEALYRLRDPIVAPSIVMIADHLEPEGDFE